MTYVRKMAEECAWRSIPHGDADEIERCIRSVVEDCAREADAVDLDEMPEEAAGARGAAARIRSLLSDGGTK